MGSIYGLLDPITNELKYIGQTRKDLKTRLDLHWKDRHQKKYANNYHGKWMRDIEVLYKTRPSIILIESVDDKDLNDKERFWVDFHLKEGKNLTNTSLAEHYYKERKNRENMYKKQVYAYKKDYTFEVFKSGREASRFLKIDYKTISSNCNGRFWSGEYVFSFTPLSNKEVDLKFTGVVLINIDIVATNKDTGETLVFRNQQDASRHFSCNFRNINQCLKGIRKSCANHYWSYGEKRITERKELEK